MMPFCFTRLRRLGALLVLPVLLAAAGCQKTTDVRPNALPAATEEGRNTIGCLIDDQLWLADDDIDGSANSPVRAVYTPGKALDVEATRDGLVFGYSRLRLHLDAQTLQPGTYTLDQGARVAFEDYETDDEDQYAAGGTTGEGALTITKVLPVAASGGSPAYTIVAGTYAFTAVSRHTGAVVHLTDGRFDVKAY